MNRRKNVALVVVGLVGSLVTMVSAQAFADEVQPAIASAQEAVEQARAAIENGKTLLAKIPSDSPLLADVRQMLQAASENWAVAVDALDGAEQSASKIASSSSESIAKDYALLAKANAGVALSGAKVVQIGLFYVEAVANEKTEALEIIRTAMQDALAATSQVQFNYERVKALIAEKYSK